MPDYTHPQEVQILFLRRLQSNCNCTGDFETDQLDITEFSLHVFTTNEPAPTWTSLLGTAPITSCMWCEWLHVTLTIALTDWSQTNSLSLITLWKSFHSFLCMTGEFYARAECRNFMIDSLNWHCISIEELFFFSNLFMLWSDFSLFSCVSRSPRGNMVAKLSAFMCRYLEKFWTLYQIHTHTKLAWSEMEN